MRFDSRLHDKLIDEISRRKCRPGQKWDHVNQVCRNRVSINPDKLSAEAMKATKPPAPKPPADNSGSNANAKVQIEKAMRASQGLNK